MNCRQWVVDVILVQTPSRLQRSNQYPVLTESLGQDDFRLTTSYGVLI